MKSLVNKLTVFASILCLFLLNGCATLVETNVEKGINFNNYQTYAWLKPEINTGDNPLYKDPMINQNIRHTVDQEIQQRGLIENVTSPDLLIQYKTYTEKKQRNYSNGMYGPYMPYGLGWGRMGWNGWGWGGYGYPYYGGGYNGYNYQYTEGTLLLEFTDNHTHEVIWRGSIEGDVENTRHLNAKVEKAVHAIMKKYPVKYPQTNHIG